MVDGPRCWKRIDATDASVQAILDLQLHYYSRPSEPSVDALDVRRRGSTTNVALNAVALGVSNAATGAHLALGIVGAGSTLHVVDCV